LRPDTKTRPLIEEELLDLILRLAQERRQLDRHVAFELMLE